MSETFLYQCPECQSKMKLPTSLVGRRGKCPSCKKTVNVEMGVVAKASSSAPPDQPDFLGQDVTFQGEREKEPEIERSMGEHDTRGDALSSIPDVQGPASTVDDSLPIVDLSERYEVQKELGKGGMGKVLLAVDKRLDRPVAIKRLLEELGSSQKAGQRFLTEAKSIAALNHYNIVQIHDFGRDKDGPFIIMELVDGQSLAERLDQGPLELQEAVTMTCQLCNALSKAHEKGIIHRDIKPANILLTKDGIPKLSDFGLARQETADHGQTAVGAILGTIDFMSPEQRVDATTVDARSDLWSLAATFYQMVTGSSPRVIDLEDVPQQLRPVISRALKREPDARFQDGESFRNALQDAFDTPLELEPVGGTGNEIKQPVGTTANQVIPQPPSLTPVAPPTGVSHVVVERKSAFTGSPMTLKVSEEGIELASIKNGKSGSFDLSPGTHTLRFKMALNPALSKTFQVVDGSTLTLRVGIKMGLLMNKLSVEQIN
jgi:serine/threonine protein kinase